MKKQKIKLDPTKPVQTRDGREAGIHSSTMRGEYPIHGWIDNDGSQEQFNWTADGRYMAGQKTLSDLENIPEAAETIPYTVKTWPLTALRYRLKGGTGHHNIGSVTGSGVLIGRDHYPTSYSFMNNYGEIAGVDGVWRNAGQEVQS